MTPEQTFGQLLGLGNAWRVVEARLDVNSSTFVLRVEETPELWPLESARAGTPVTCHDHVQPMQWRHLNVFNKECVIVCALPRGRRGNDGKVYRVTPPWEGRSKHFTQEFEAFALTLMREMPVKRAGQILGESDSRMWRMLFAHVKAAHARLSFENVVWVGADEMNRRKGHNYLTVFADLMTKRVLFATPGKDASVWETFSAELLRHNGHPKAIQHVAIDMSAAYTKGVSENLGNARVVYDKFHVIQNVVEACDEVRKAESRASAGKREQLERTRWMWRKNRVNWTEKETQKWESMALERGVSAVRSKCTTSGRVKLYHPGLGLVIGFRGWVSRFVSVDLGCRREDRALQECNPSARRSRVSESVPLPVSSHEALGVLLSSPANPGPKR